MYFVLIFGLIRSHDNFYKGELLRKALNTFKDIYILICFWFQGVFIIARDSPSHFNLTKVIEMRTKCSRIFTIDISFPNLLVSYTNIDSHILPHIHMHTSPMNSNWILKHACWWYVQISQSFNGIWHQMLLKNLVQPYIHFKHFIHVMLNLHIIILCFINILSSKKLYVIILKIYII